MFKEPFESGMTSCSGMASPATLKLFQSTAEKAALLSISFRAFHTAAADLHTFRYEIKTQRSHWWRIRSVQQKIPTEAPGRQMPSNSLQPTLPLAAPAILRSLAQLNAGEQVVAFPSSPGICAAEQLRSAAVRQSDCLQQQILRSVLSRSRNCMNFFKSAQTWAWGS